MTNSDLFSRRSFFAAIAGGGVWTALLARSFQLQVLEGQRYADLAAENSVRLVLKPALRGRIYDRFGEALASDRRGGRVSIVRELIGDEDAVRARLVELSRYIALNDAQIDSITRRAFQNAAFQPTLVNDGLSFDDYARLAIITPDLQGVSAELASVRYYPRGDSLVHALGYVQKANGDDLVRLTDDLRGQEARMMRRMLRHPDMRVGKRGVEYFADDWLRGEAGFVRTIANAAGREIKELPSEDVAPKQGKDIWLTLDIGLQEFGLKQFDGQSGAAVVIDVETGDILAMCSAPTYDPNPFVNGISTTDYAKLRDNTEFSPLYHKAYDGTYPPGSTFKMIVAYAALKNKITTPNESVFCPGHYDLGRRRFHCWKKTGHGHMNLHLGLKHSCDTYFYELARRLGVDQIAEAAKAFGLGHNWELGITGGRAGLVPSSAWKQETHNEQWVQGDTLNIGIGQGYLHTSPLQLAIMTGRIATGGRMPQPRFIGNGPKVSAQLPILPPLDAAIIERLKAGMAAVTTEAGGTARRVGDLGVDGLQMAGKTGTAQVRRISTQERLGGVRSGDEIERKLRDHALFVGYAPVDAPRYAVSVVVEHGESGGRVAGPIARDMLAYAIKNKSGRKVELAALGPNNTDGQG